MNLFRHGDREPLWREEFSIHGSDERYVNRRQFAKFLVLTSLGMFVGNLWILIRSVVRRKPEYPSVSVGRVDEIAAGTVKVFHYPEAGDSCLLVRHSDGSFSAFSQKCTHLSCAVIYAPGKERLECPCHEGYFSARDGAVLQGPPRRGLPRIVLERRGDMLVAVGVDLQSGPGEVRPVDSRS